MTRLRSATLSAAAIALGLFAGGGVLAQSEEEPVAPAPFTGTLSYGDCTGAEQTETRPGVLSRRGEASCRPGVLEAFSDARLDGDATIWWNDDTYADGVRVEHGGFTITNDEGSWEQIPDINVVFPDGTGTTRTSVFVGQGAYEGLTAIAEIALADAVWTFEGVILDGEILRQGHLSRWSSRTRAITHIGGPSR